ncbi:TspO/MBR family protein [Alteromonas flava]|uniref:TspO/MBR family protein n=1 Tax=Alteromonas flava TaxID=2048003 RepID=UPI000C2933CE|nr:TspO/MBR family protein [Alteromonas flava]
MQFREWYDALAKPDWTPDPAFIGMMWQILYPIIIVTFAWVFIQIWRKKYPKGLALPFAINLIANLIFTPIQFGLRNLELATLDILVVWGTIVWMIVAVWRHNKWVALAQLPYLAWVSVATVLQTMITVMNW